MPTNPNENLVDQPFLDRYRIGFDEEQLPAGVEPGSSYKAYVLGKGPDQTPKTPEWGAKITGCPAQTIIKLAREIWTAKPVCIMQVWGPQRRANGDTTARAICVLAAITGNIGISGGGCGSSETVNQIPFNAKLPIGENPVKKAFVFYTWEDAIKNPEKVTAKRLALKGGDKTVYPIPVYESTWEGPDDYETAKKYPFQLFGNHFKGRVHTSYGNLSNLKKVVPQVIWMNPLDAESRGIKHGDLLEVFNDRGKLRIPVKVTPRIMPGVLGMHQSA